jgi:hypothetical protein
MLNIVRINSFFHAFGNAVIRFRWLVFAVFLGLTVSLAMGLPHLKADVDQDSWFMEDDELLKAKDRMEAIFGNEDFCAVLVTADDVFAPENLRLLRELGDELMERIPYADDVQSLADMEFTEGVEGGIRIDELVPDVIPQDGATLDDMRKRALAKTSLKNRMVSEDCTETWLILRMKKLPDVTHQINGEDPIMAVGHMFNEVVNQPKYAPLHPKTAGIPVVFADKLDFFGKETPKLLGISLLFAVFTLLFFLRSVRGVVFPMATVGCVMIIVFGAQGFLGIGTDPTVIFMPIFITLAVSIGYSIHMFNHFNIEFKKTGKRRESLLQAVEEVGWPLLFSALTTVAALLSFIFIPLRPIRWVGMTSALLVLLACIVVLTLLPALLSFGKDRPARKDEKEVRETRIQRCMGWLGTATLNRPRLSLVMLVVLMGVCVAGIFKVEVSFDVIKSFGRRIPYVDRIYSVGQSQVGSLYSYNLALEFDEPGAAKEPGNLKKFEKLVEDIHGLELTKKTTSLLEILKDLNQVIHEGDPAWYRLPESREMVAQLLLLYENAGGAEVERWIDYDYQRLKLQVEMGHYNSGEAARELDWIQDEVRRVFPHAHVVLTGSISQYTVMQEYVSFGQIKSFFIAFMVVTLLMMLVFGSLKIGFIAMIPNIAPALVVGGIMGYAGVPLDLVTVTIIPMLLGLAVDDTIHFINHYQLEFGRCRNYALGNRKTFLAVGGALLMTTIVLTLTFAAYMVSVVKIFIFMGILVGSGLFAALAADYFITPVLIAWAKPFGPEEQDCEAGKTKPAESVSLSNPQPEVFAAEANTQQQGGYHG